jgi:hypothetical protein
LLEELAACCDGPAPARQALSALAHSALDADIDRRPSADALARAARMLASD